MEKEHLPIYGVGPFYGVGIIAATVIGIVLSVTGVIKSGRIENTGLIVGFIVMGLVILLLGFFIWKAAALGSKSIDKYIELNTLCTTGVYSIVRNPCYSGIMLMCTGLLFMVHNLWLLILPVVYWLAMTILMKCSEEKWLKDLYGQEYVEYCKTVNRCIPWFPKK